MNKEFKYQFILDVQKVYLRIPSQCNVQIWWKRQGKGKGKTNTKNAVKLKGGQSYFKINQPLIIQGRCVLRGGIFQPKQTMIQIVIFNFDNSTKLGGLCKLDVTKMISTTNVTMNHIQNFQLPLQSTPDKNAKIVFTLSVKFLGECSQDSMNDISFQGPNNLNQTSDMTFRPVSVEKRFSQQIRYAQQQFIKHKQPLQLQRHYQQQNIPRLNGQRPLQFSFNPISDPERDKMNKVHLQLISQLRQQINDKNKQIQSLKQRIIKIEENQRKTYTIHNQKSLNLMNELNISNNKCEQFKKEIKEYIKNKDNLQKLNQQFNNQKRELLNQIKKGKQDNNQISFKFQKIEKQHLNSLQSYKQLNKRCQQLMKQKQQLKQELFKKQSTFINLQNKYQKQIQILKSKGNNDLIQVSQQMKDIKQKHEQIYRQNLQLKHENVQLKKILNEKTKQLEKINSSKLQIQYQLQQIRKSISQIVKQKQRQKQSIQKKYELLQVQFKTKQTQLRQIQELFNQLQSNNFSNSKQKDQQIILLRDKVNNSVFRLQQVSKKQQSNLILISQLKVKIKNLETVCTNLQKQVDEKDQIIQQKQSILEKAKIYVKQKQTQLQQRDQFIENAKNYVAQKQKQFQQQKKKIQDYKRNLINNQSNTTKQTQSYKKRISQLSSEIIKFQNILKQKQGLLFERQDYINHLRQNFNSRDQRMEGLQNYIRSLQQRLQITQDQLQQVNRKNKGLNQTLEELVRKNFETQIQLNIKTAQLDAVRSY